MKFEVEALNGTWHYLLSEYTGYPISYFDPRKPNKPCPCCGGDDRFSYTNKHGNGTVICRKCMETGSDGVGFLAKYFQKERKDIYKMLASRYGTPSGIQTIKRIPKEETEPEPEIELIISAKEAWDGRSIINKDKKYRFSSYYRWNDEDKNLIGYIARGDFSNGKKFIWQILWGKSVHGEGWHQTSIHVNRPLLGLDTLNKSETVLVVEGEKTQARASVLFPDLPVISTVGGSNTVAISNLEPLKNKAVVIWPDNDEAGIKYQNQILAKITQAKIIEVESLNLPEAWDLADDLEVVGLTREGIKKLIEEAPNYFYDLNFINHLDFLFGIDVMKKINTAEIEVIEKTKIDFLAEEINPVGHFENRYFCCPRRHGQLISYSPSDMSKNGMKALASLSYWMEAFPKVNQDMMVTGVDWEFAIDWFIESCLEKGLFKPSKIRGVGLWEDDNRLVLNTGKEIIINDKRFKPEDFSSKFFYERHTDEVFKLADSLTLEDLEVLIKAPALLNWEDQSSILFIQGIMVQGIIPALLKWRPSAHITGPSGGGKTTIIDRLVQAVWKGPALYLEGDSTAKGIIQMLNNCAIPVVFDELEGNEENDRMRIQAIYSVNRSNSSGTDSVVAKGTADHKGKQFSVTTTMIFASVESSIKQKSDETRIAKLAIKAPFTIDSGHDEAYEQQKKDYEEFVRLTEKIDVDFARRFQTFVIKNAQKVLANIAPSREILIQNGFSGRLADQFGSLLACASIIYEEANKLAQENYTFKSWINSQLNYIQTGKELMETSQEVDMLNLILAEPVQIGLDSGLRTLPLSFAIKAIDKASRSFITAESTNPEIITLNEKLKAQGVKITEKEIYFSSKSAWLQKVTGKVDYASTLSRIDGAFKTQNTITFGGRTNRYRAIGFPLAMLLEEE